MKKRFINNLTIFALLIFLISALTVSVVAEEGSNNTTVNNSVEGSNMDSTVDDNGGEGEKALADRITDSRTTIRTLTDGEKRRIGQARIAAKARYEQERENTKRRFEETNVGRERYKELLEQAKDKFETNKELYKAAKETVKEKRKLLEQCEGDHSSECLRIRSETKVEARNLMLHSADQIIAFLTKARDRYENSDINEEDKQEAIDELDEMLEDLAAAREVIAKIGEGSTAEEVHEAAKVIKDSWKEARDILKRRALFLSSHHIGGILRNSEQVLEKLDKILVRLEEAGHDTSNLEEHVAELKEKIDEAKLLHEEAKELFQAGEVAAAAEKIRESKEKLKDARELLRDIIRIIKSGNVEEDDHSADGDEHEKTNETGEIEDHDDSLNQTDDDLNETEENGTNETA